jgi:hypothetical protein
MLDDFTSDQAELLAAIAEDPSSFGRRAQLSTTPRTPLLNGSMARSQGPESGDSS